MYGIYEAPAGSLALHKDNGDENTVFVLNKFNLACSYTVGYVLMEPGQL